MQWCAQAAALRLQGREVLMGAAVTRHAAATHYSSLDEVRSSCVLECLGSSIKVYTSPETM